VEYGDPGAQGGDVLGLVAGQDHRAPLTGVRDHLPEPQPLLGIEADRRLVEEEQVWIAQQGLGQPDPPAHPAGEGPDPLGADGRQPGQLDDPADLVVPGPPVGHLLEDRHVVDELEDGEPPVEAGFLRQVAQAFADPGPVVGARRVEAQ
jgi:hypothetical protein